MFQDDIFLELSSIAESLFFFGLFISIKTHRLCYGIRKKKNVRKKFSGQREQKIKKQFCKHKLKSDNPIERNAIDFCCLRVFSVMFVGVLNVGVEMDTVFMLLIFCHDVK